MELYCDATCLQWSPDGKRLALWPHGQYYAGAGQGLEPFLPPVGKEDAGLSDTEVIERYFQQTLALGLEALPTYHYPWFLVQYAQALEHMGKVEVAEARYRQALEFVRRSPRWDKTPVVHSYAAFLRQHGRGQEAAELLASVPIIQGVERVPCGVTHACEEGGGVGRPDAPEHAHTGMPPVRQPLPPFYIVTVPDLSSR